MAIVDPTQHLPPAPEREHVRAFAQHVQSHANDVARSGGNPFQAMIDQTELVKAFAAGMPDEVARERFLRMYDEELKAVAGQQRVQNIKRAKASIGLQMLAAIIVIWLFAFFVWP
jgi:hypothetical protein